MIPPETITRLRNALAQVALDWLDAPASGQTSAASALPFSSMTEADWRAAVTLWRQHAGILLEDLATRPCPACGADSSRFLFFSYDAHPFHECDTCGCWYEPKVVDTSLFERLFERSPEARELAARMMTARDRDEGRDADLARIGGYLDELLPLLPAVDLPARRYLDTGCGVGHSLRAGRLRGLDVQGVEADETAAALARAAGLPVVGLSEPVPSGPYHLLSFWETLEHVTDPLGALERYLPLLAVDGLVAITVPNLQALASRSLHESCAWVHGGYNTPGHVNLFGPASLEQLLKRAGLTMIDADGQFSANPVELAAYLTGNTRGAFDVMAPRPATGMISSQLAAVLAGAWPGAALLERLSLLSPILHVVACRAGREATFAPAIAARRQQRLDGMAAAARALLEGEPDYKGMAAELQTEVDRRDQLIATTVAGLQHEIALRDERQRATVAELQAEIARRDDLLATTSRAMQQEIDARDALLEGERNRLAATIDARVRRAARRAGQVFKSR